MTERPSTIVISDWLANCQVGQWTPFEAATALKDVLAKEGYAIVRARAAWDKGEHEGCGVDSQRTFNAAALERTAGRWQAIETMPTADGLYLIANDRGQVCPVQQRDGRGIVQNMVGYADWDYGSLTTSWQPLPAAPSPDDQPEKQA